MKSWKNVHVDDLYFWGSPKFSHHMLFKTAQRAPDPRKIPEHARNEARYEVPTASNSAMSTCAADQSAPAQKPAEDTKECSDSETSVAGDSTGRYSLYSTTGKNIAMSVSSIIILSHALLLWGQLGELWGFFAVDSINVTASINSTLGAIIESPIFGSSNTTSPANIVTNSSVLIDSFSYGDMVYELWIQPYPLTRFTAVLLILFSAVWPHLKLFLLHLYFYLPTPSIPRRSALYWLGSMGKLSLADICATCMIFMLLNLTVTMDVGTLASDAAELIQDVVPIIVNGTDGKLSNITQSLVNQVDEMTFEKVDSLSQSIFENDDPELYASLLQKGCGSYYSTDCTDTPFYEPTEVRGGLAGIMAKCLRIRNDECSQCECIVNNVIFNDAIPEDVEEAVIDEGISMLFAKVLAFAQSGRLNLLSLISMEGVIEVGTKVQAYPAFISFTLGVILSIVASMVVDKIEERDTMQKNCGVSTVQAFLEKKGMRGRKPATLFFSETERLWTKLGKAACSLGTIPITTIALYVEMFDWKIAGLFEEILLVQRTAVNLYFSIIDCVVNVNDGTGYGWTFTVLYGFFMLGAPMLRAVLLTTLGIIPLSPAWHIRLAHWSNTVGGFIGWEPFFICVILLMFELPSLTGATVPEATCNSVEAQTFVARLISAFDLDTAYCFIMYFNVFPSFLLFVAAWAWLTAFNAVAWKAMLKKYDIFGNYEKGQRGGPYCTCRQCCFCPRLSTCDGLRTCRPKSSA